MNSPGSFKKPAGVLLSTGSAKDGGCSCSAGACLELGGAGELSARDCSPGAAAAESVGPAAWAADLGRIAWLVGADGNFAGCSRVSGVDVTFLTRFLANDGEAPSLLPRALHQAPTMYYISKVMNGLSCSCRAQNALLCQSRTSMPREELSRHLSFPAANRACMPFNECLVCRHLPSCLTKVCWHGGAAATMSASHSLVTWRRWQRQSCGEHAWRCVFCGCLELRGRSAVRGDAVHREDGPRVQSCYDRDWHWYVWGFESYIIVLHMDAWRPRQ